MQQLMLIIGLSFFVNAAFGMDLVQEDKEDTKMIVITKEEFLLKKASVPEELEMQPLTCQLLELHIQKNGLDHLKKSLSLELPYYYQKPGNPIEYYYCFPVYLRLDTTIYHYHIEEPTLKKALFERIGKIIEENNTGDTPRSCLFNPEKNHIDNNTRYYLKVDEQGDSTEFVSTIYDWSAVEKILNKQREPQERKSKISICITNSLKGIK